MNGVRALLMAGLLVSMCAPGRVASGQAAWEYAPYRVRVRVALESVPQLPPALVATFGEQVAARSATVLGAVWQVETLAASPKLTDELFRSGQVSVDGVVAAAAEDVNGDKLYLAAIACRDGGYEVTVRELDCRARQLGEVCERWAPSLAALGPALWDAVLESFTPLAKLETVEESRITARLRAGGLIVDPASPALIDKGMVLRPIIRRNDRTGQPVKGGIQLLPWTLLEVSERRDSLLETKLSSAFRAAIPSRGSARLERLALLVRSRWASTRLILQSRTDAAKPLAGYEIHVKVPGGEQQQTELLGVTDVDGAVVLPQGDGRMELLYVKSGKQLLARLPILPGQAESLVANVVDDDRRLQAEGLILAMQSRALDLVARREILAAKIRARLKAGNLAEAQQLLDDFRKMETRQDLSRDLDQYRQRVSSPDRITQARIENLFLEAQKLLTLKPLSDDLLAELTRELSTSQTGGLKTGGS